MSVFKGILDNTADMTRKNSQQLDLHETKKVDLDDYRKENLDQDERIETIRLGAKDNFMQLMATDNYLEKYLPMRIQFQIGESLRSILNHVPEMPVKESSHLWEKTEDSKIMKRF